MRKNRRWIGSRLIIIPALGITLLFGAMAVLAAPIPNTFTAGAPISAAAVNANFANIEARVAALETVNATAAITPASLAGSWAMFMTINSSAGSNATCSTTANQGVFIENETLKGIVVVDPAGATTISVTGNRVATSFWGAPGETIASVLDVSFATGGTAPIGHPLTRPITCGSNYDAPVVQNGGGLFTFTGGALNTITLNALGIVFTGNISQNGQMAVLHGTNPTFHKNIMITLIKVGN